MIRNGIYPNFVLSTFWITHSKSKAWISHCAREQGVVPRKNTRVIQNKLSSKSQQREYTTWTNHGKLPLMIAYSVSWFIHHCPHRRIMSKWGSRCASATLKPTITFMKLSLWIITQAQLCIEDLQKNLWFPVPITVKCKVNIIHHRMLCHVLLYHVKKPRPRGEHFWNSIMSEVTPQMQPPDNSTLHCAHRCAVFTTHLSTL